MLLHLFRDSKDNSLDGSGREKGKKGCQVGFQVRRWGFLLTNEVLERLGFAQPRVPTTPGFEGDVSVEPFGLRSEEKMKEVAEMDAQAFAKADFGLYPFNTDTHNTCMFL